MKQLEWSGWLILLGTFAVFVAVGVTAIVFARPFFRWYVSSKRKMFPWLDKSGYLGWPPSERVGVWGLRTAGSILIAGAVYFLILVLSGD